MAKTVALFLLLGFVSVVLCGFLVNQQILQHTVHGHTDSGYVIHHFSMWTDFSTALVSDVAAYIATITLIVGSVFLLSRTSFLSPQAFAFSRTYGLIPIRTIGLVRLPPELRQWLSMLELSPSFV
jgi:hypothetical protein